MCGIYYAVLPLHDDYLDLQRQYNDAVAQGDVLADLVLSGRLVAAKLAFETSFEGDGLGNLMAQMSDAEAQLADAETQLADGEKALADGYTQLAAADTN